MDWELKRERDSRLPAVGSTKRQELERGRVLDWGGMGVVEKGEGECILLDEGKRFGF